MSIQLWTFFLHNLDFHTPKFTGCKIFILLYTAAATIIYYTTIGQKRAMTTYSIKHCFYISREQLIHAALKLFEIKSLIQYFTMHKWELCDKGCIGIGASKILDTDPHCIQCNSKHQVKAWDRNTHTPRKGLDDDDKLLAENPIIFSWPDTSNFQFSFQLNRSRSRSWYYTGFSHIPNLFRARPSQTTVYCWNIYPLSLLKLKKIKTSCANVAK